MNCEQIQYQLSDLIRNNLSDAETINITNHIGECLDCKKEYESLKLVITEIEKDEYWKPASEYWNNILPRVHERIELKNNSTINTRFIRYAVQSAAAILILVALLQIFTFRGINNQPYNENQIAQLSSDELQDYIHQQIISGVDESITHVEISSSLDADKMIVKEIFNEDNSVSTYLSSDDENLYDTITDKTADRVISLIEKKML